MQLYTKFDNMALIQASLAKATVNAIQLLMNTAIFATAIMIPKVGHLMHTFKQAVFMLVI